jgi:hypothetical protein
LRLWSSQISPIEDAARISIIRERVDSSRAAERWRVVEDHAKTASEVACRVQVLQSASNQGTHHP